MHNFASLPSSILLSYPPVDEGHVDAMLAKERKDFSKKIIVLDDDPTGIQTVHDVFVYTDWEEKTIAEGFEEKNPMFFLLTNSRSFTKEETLHTHIVIAQRIGKIAKQKKQDYLIISRGDSTLRGHYPLETKAIRDTLLQEFHDITDGEIICPFFKEGGRFTLNNTHYVMDGDLLVPAGNSEFAKDKTFGFTASHLGDYVEEKSHGTYLSHNCIYISIEEIRFLQLEEITEKLLSATDFAKIIVNAIDYIDLKIFSIAWIRAMKQGKNYIVRSAAALPKVIGNISTAPLLCNQDLINCEETNGGIVIIGSYVKKTTAQLQSLMDSKKELTFLEFDVSQYFEEGGLTQEVQRILALTHELIASGKTVIIYTSRKLLVTDSADKDKILEAYVHISDALTSIIRLLTLKPRFIIAKGGITSSDVGTKGLHVKKARVMGQIKKGIPVWMTGEESKFPNTPYIIFPGNVGEVDTLREIVEELC